MGTLFKQITLITVLFITLFSCCNDDDNIPNNELTTEELLIGKWVYNVLPTGDATACEAKTFYHFFDSENVFYQSVRDYTGFLYEADQGEVVGDCFYFNEDTTSYSLVNNLEIMIDYPSGTRTLNIVSINNATLVITQPSPSGVDTIELTKEF